MSVGGPHHGSKVLRFEDIDKLQSLLLGHPICHAAGGVTDVGGLDQVLYPCYLQTPARLPNHHTAAMPTCQPSGPGGRIPGNNILAALASPFLTDIVLTPTMLVCA